MRIFESLEEIEDIRDTVIAVGNFDGVHRGHQEIIRRTVHEAKAIGIASAVFTFSNHPRKVLQKKNAVKNIQYRSDKIRIFEEMGIDYLFSIPFDEKIMNTPADVYIEDILLKKMRMREIFCGFNYRFGHKAGGDVEYLMKRSLELGFGTHILEPFKVDGQVVSSTLIRKLIAEGEMEECEKFLGRFYSLSGTVVKGNQIGRTIGFPTCNLTVDEGMVTPPNGVYVTRCHILTGEHAGEVRPSITNVGHKPTIGEYAKNIETHLLQFKGDLYDDKINVEFIRLLREEQKFDSIEELTKQIERDTISARVYHREHPHYEK